MARIRSGFGPAGGGGAAGRTTGTASAGGGDDFWDGRAGFAGAVRTDFAATGRTGSTTAGRTSFAAPGRLTAAGRFTAGFAAFAGAVFGFGFGFGAVFAGRFATPLPAAFAGRAGGALRAPLFFTVAAGRLRVAEVFLAVAVRPFAAPLDAAARFLGAAAGFF